VERGGQSGRARKKKPCHYYGGRGKEVEGKGREKRGRRDQRR